VCFCYFLDELQNLEELRRAANNQTSKSSIYAFVPICVNLIDGRRWLTIILDTSPFIYGPGALEQFNAVRVPTLVTIFAFCFLLQNRASTAGVVRRRTCVPIVLN